VLRQDDGNLRLFRDENALLRQPGARVRTETFDDGSTRTTVLRDDGTEIVTIRAADGSDPAPHAGAARRPQVL
jgi:hypothetical protein